RQTGGDGDHASPRHHQDGPRRPRSEDRLGHDGDQEHGRSRVQEFSSRRQPSQLHIPGGGRGADAGQTGLRSTALSLMLAGVMLPVAAQAAPTLLPVWQDHAVIQRDRPVVVEGSAAPGQQVSATLGQASATARAGNDGTFRQELPARPATADLVTLPDPDSSGSPTVPDIVVGDVWLCSGQSNMAFTVGAGLNGANNIQTSADPLLRMLTVPLDTATKPVREFGGKVAWQSASPATTGEFSGACYYMLRDLR